MCSKTSSPPTKAATVAKPTGSSDPRSNRRGRPSRVEGEVATARIWAWLTPQERTRLLRVALENRLTIAQVVREAVNDFVAEYSENGGVFSDTGKSGRAAL
jgi:hypothetical protein